MTAFDPPEAIQPANFLDLLEPRMKVVFAEYFRERVALGTFYRTEFSFHEDADAMRVLVTVIGAEIPRKKLREYFDRGDYAAIDKAVRGMIDHSVRRIAHGVRARLPNQDDAG